jgi:hypothetical protein
MPKTTRCEIDAGNPYGISRCSTAATGNRTGHDINQTQKPPISLSARRGALIGLGQTGKKVLDATLKNTDKIALKLPKSLRTEWNVG